MTEETKDNNIENEGQPVCEVCGNAKLYEDEEWVCPHCQGEIDFLGEENSES